LTFGGTVPTSGLTGGAVIGTDVDEDGAGTTSTTTDGCSALDNAAAVAGKFAILDRG
jgi:hypothetical protein